MHSICEYPYIVRQSSSRQIVRQKVDDWLRRFPQLSKPAAQYTSTGNPREFASLTGLSQKTLEDFWSRGKRLTSCNAFVGMYSQTLLKRYLGRFDLKEALGRMNLPEAWIEQADDLSARPGYGDIVRWHKLHVGVSLDFENGKWHSIEGGQGVVGKHGSVKRKVSDYDPSKIMGWVDLAVLYEGLYPEG